MNLLNYQFACSAGAAALRLSLDKHITSSLYWQLSIFRRESNFVDTH